jgi:hypothetical protein
MAKDSSTQSDVDYTGPTGCDHYTIAFELFVEIDGEFADAMLADVHGDHRHVIAVEVKESRDPLDIKWELRYSIPRFAGPRSGDTARLDPFDPSRINFGWNRR